MIRFRPMPPYKNVYLYTSADVVQFSYMVHNTISYLNLELCKSYPIIPQLPYNPILLPEHIYGHPSFTYSSDIIQTEEKCQKVLSNCRSLLYNLHLDLPRGREVRFKKDFKFLDYTHDHGFISPIIGICKITHKDKFHYAHTLMKHVAYACNYSVRRNAILKWFVKLDFIDELKLCKVFAIAAEYIVNSIIAESSDMEFISEFFRKVKVELWFVYVKSSEKVENLLFQLHKIDRKLELKRSMRILQDCFLQDRSVGAVLKILDVPMFSGSLCNEMWDNITITSISSNLDLRDIFNIRKKELTNQRRRNLLLYLLYSYYKSWPIYSSSLEPMRLVWKSIPDVFLSYEEIATWCAPLGPETVQSIYDFYYESVSEVDSFNVRSLKHFCRVFIRKRLRERNEWLPAGIGKLGLPRTLQAYLKLEEVQIFNPASD